ncbi:MAG: hypothetical protein LUO84_05920 [Methanomassiliicoccales archaeon]|nr:hypothetical protein [Methanomassiliicoccales archaeon]
MRLLLRMIQDLNTGKGVIEVLEQKTITCRARVGMISYDDEAGKKFFVDALTQMGNTGEVIPLKK